MSHRNEALICAAMEAWNRGDWAEALKQAAPNLVVDNSATEGEWSGIHRGLDEVKRMWRQFVDGSESVRIEIEELIDAGDGVVVTRQRTEFVGSDGSVQRSPSSGRVWTIRDGSLVHVAAYDDFGEALEAAGLSE